MTERLIVVCGLPGVGKTTVASQLADRLDGSLLRTDTVRKELYPDPDYTAAETEATYDEVLARAGAALDRGGTAVLDGTFRRATQREAARAVAADRGAAFDLVLVECRREAVRRRIAERDDDASDADFEIHELVRSEFEPLTDPHHTIDNSGPVAETRRQVAELFSAMTVVDRPDGATIDD